MDAEPVARRSMFKPPPPPKPKKRKSPAACATEGCGRTKSDRSSRYCGWCWLTRQPAEVQAAAARTRLARRSPERYRARVPEAQWAPDCRWCAGCQSMIPLLYVPVGGSRCVACTALGKYESHLRSTYDIGHADVLAMLSVQDGRCAGCRCTARTRRLDADHDHKTDEMRGMLCTQCNNVLRLAAFHGDPLTTLKNLVSYLENTPWEKVQEKGSA